MSKQIDYELDQYDEYMERAQHLGESGSVAEVGAFAALADLCYEKVRMVQWNCIAADHRQPGVASRCADLRYDIT